MKNEASVWWTVFGIIAVACLCVGGLAAMCRVQEGNVRPSTSGGFLIEHVDVSYDLVTDTKTGVQYLVSHWGGVVELKRKQ